MHWVVVVYTVTSLLENKENILEIWDDSHITAGEKLRAALEIHGVSHIWVRQR